MIHLNRLQTPFSADVRLELDIGERIFRLGKCGPGYAYLLEPAQIPAGRAIMNVTVDGNKYVLQIVVKHNHAEVPFDNRIEFRILSEDASENELAACRQLSRFDDPICP